MAERDLDTNGKLNDCPLYTKIRYINSTTYYVNEPIVVASEEKLVIDNTKMVFNCSYDGEFYIIVASGGGFEIRNGSYLTINRTGGYSDNYGYNYFIQANISSNIKISDTNISYIGSEVNIGYGLLIKCDSAIFFNVSFYRSYNPICQELTSNSVIDSCSFIDIKENAVQFNGNEYYYLIGHRIIKSSFKDINNTAIKFNNILKNRPLLLKNTTITNNTIINAMYGLGNITGHDYKVNNNHFEKCNVYAIRSDIALNSEIINNRIFHSKNGIFSRDGYSSFNINNNIFFNIENVNIELLVQAANIDEYRVIIKDNVIHCGKYGIKGMCTETDILNNFITNVDNAIDIYHYNYANPPSSINILNNTIKNCSSGIITKENDKLRIEKNIISNIRTDAISLDKVLGYDIEKNIIDNITGNGINITNSIELSGYPIKIDSNDIKNCSTGIYLSSNEPDILPKDNVIENCSEGVRLRYMDGGGLSRNNISGCGKGIVIESSARNLILDRNNLVGNDVHAVDEGANTWDNGTWGNYWSDMDDYNDWDGDGIVDRPINIDADSVDRYPLIVPWGQPWNRKIELDPFISEHRVETSRLLNLTFTASDPDGDLPYFKLEASREVEFDLDNSTGEFSYRPKKDDVGFVEFNVTVYDRNGTRDTGKFVVEVLYLNLPPVLEPVDNITTYPGIRVERELFFHDPNGDNVAVYVDSTNAPFRFSIKDNRYLVFTAGEDQTGVFWVKLTLSDGNGSQSHHIINVFVIPYNVAPVIGDMFDLVSYTGETSSYVLNVSDVNGDELTKSASFDGNGSCWVEGMFLKLRPDITDVGNRTLTITVDDNNGSVVSRDFSVKVVLRNRAPEGPRTFFIRVEAGDVQRDKIGITDPDGDGLSLLSVEPELDWLELLIEDGIQITSRPTMVHLGVQYVVLNITDGRGGYLEVGLKVDVYEGMTPTLNLSVHLDMKEKQRLVQKLGTDHGKNGTISYHLMTESGFITLEGDELLITPVHGDHGIHNFSIETSVVGGSARTTEHVLNVSYDLSTLMLEIKIEPQKERYEKGELITIRVEHSGYDANLDLSMIISLDGRFVSRLDDDNGQITLTEDGEYRIAVHLKDHGPVGDERSIFSDAPEGPTPRYQMITLFIALFLIIIIIAVSIFIWKRGIKGSSELLDVKDDGTFAEGQGPQVLSDGVMDGPGPIPIEPKSDVVEDMNTVDEPLTNDDIGSATPEPIQPPYDEVLPKMDIIAVPELDPLDRSEPPQEEPLRHN
ncbi:MAG: right-handed parallel beta-helix repeat-containing protein [Candidatus Thermoplasmatota archaeon]|nr:right-handed parallel beta-helix repeat-containing protein [Candidatus Thermoplasmatota archaeon]